MRDASKSPSDCGRKFSSCLPPVGNEYSGQNSNERQKLLFVVDPTTKSVLSISLLNFLTVFVVTLFGFYRIFQWDLCGQTSSRCSTVRLLQQLAILLFASFPTLTKATFFECITAANAALLLAIALCYFLTLDSASEFRTNFCSPVVRKWPFAKAWPLSKPSEVTTDPETTEVALKAVPSPLEVEESPPYQTVAPSIDGDLGTASDKIEDADDADTGAATQPDLKKLESKKEVTITREVTDVTKFVEKSLRMSDAEKGSRRFLSYVPRKRLSRCLEATGKIVQSFSSDVSTSDTDDGCDDIIGAGSLIPKDSDVFWKLASSGPRNKRRLSLPQTVTDQLAIMEPRPILKRGRHEEPSIEDTVVARDCFDCFCFACRFKSVHGYRRPDVRQTPRAGSNGPARSKNVTFEPDLAEG